MMQKNSSVGNVPKALAGAIAIGVLVLVLFPLGLGARGGAEPEVPEDDAATGFERPRPAIEQMQRLQRIGARFGATGGEWVDEDLPEETLGQDPPSRSAREFSTDFSRALIPFDDIVAGGPPKDGIPAVDAPQFVSIAEADRWIEESEPVIVYRRDGVARIYPLQILTWHEIVNDTVAGRPISVTYCPLCNTGMVFDRVFEGDVLDFGVSGRLIYSNMIMYDRPTESWWIQATGQAIAGHYAGQRLRLLPSSMLSWRDAKSAYEDADVLSRDTGHRRDYGRNPYSRYDSSDRPFLYTGPDVVPEGENPMERILSVYHDEETRAVSYDLLASDRLVRLEFSDAVVVVFWQEGTSSALDHGRIAEGRDVGSAVALYAEVNGRSLEFAADGDGFVDEQTGSTWSVVGRAESGPLEGSELPQALAVEHFRFSYGAFHAEPE